MDSCSRALVRILTVLLIHDVVFCGCNAFKIETPNRVIKSYTDEYQRKERQAPIDPSRMYLPPKIDAVASSGFGGQVEASNNFGDNINGYGEIGLVQDTTYNKGLSTEDSNYDVSTKAANDLKGGGQTTIGSYDTGTTSGSGGSSSDQSTSYNIFSPEENNFRQIPNKNNEYKSDQSSPGTSNYGSSLDTKSTPSKTDVATQTSSAKGHGQDELLNTAQSQGIVQNNYNKLTEDRKFGQTPGVDKQYDRGAVQNAANGYDDNTASNLSKTSLQDSSRNVGQNMYDGHGNNRNIGLSENKRFSGNNNDYRNTVSNSFDQKPTIGDYSSVGNTGYSYERPSIDFAGFSILSPIFNNQNNPSKSAPKTNNENYGSTWSTQSSQLGEYNQRETLTSKYRQFSNDQLNQGAFASTQSHENNFNEKPNTGCYSQNLKNTNLPPGELSDQLLPYNNNKFEQNPTNLCNQKPTEINGNKIGSTSFASSQDLSSVDSNNGLQTGQSYNSYSSRDYDKFNQKGSLNYEKGFNSNQQQSPTEESNNYGQSGSNLLRNGGNYAQNVLANNEYSNRGSSSNALSGFDQQNREPFNNYRQSGPQSLVNGENSIQSSSTAPGNIGEYNRGSPNSFDQSSPSTSQISNNFGHAGSHISSLNRDNYGQSGPVSSGNGGHNQRDSSNRSNGIEPNKPITSHGGSNDHGSTARSQTSSAIEGDYGENNRNSLTNDGYTQRNLVGSSQSYGINDASEQQIPSGQGAYNQASTALDRNSYAQTYAASRNSLHTVTGGSSQGSPGSLPNHHRHTIKGTCATVCRTKIGQNVLSNSANAGLSAGSSTGNRNQKKYSTLVPKGQYQNSNLPSQGIFEKQEKESFSNNINNNGEPVLNSLSNFTPGSPLNRPPPVDNDQPGANSFSNFTPDNLPNQPPPIDNDQPGANSFSNFAPDNLPNQPPPIDNDQPGANSFSNFAPDNLPNQPPPIDNDQPGANSFSNFAPDNLPNRPPPMDNDQPGTNSFSNFEPGNLPNLPSPAFNNGEPGANAFSNFAPSNLPNLPPPSTNLNSGNNCGKSNGNNANKQTTEGVFPNVGY